MKKLGEGIRDSAAAEEPKRKERTGEQKVVKGPITSKMRERCERVREDDKRVNLDIERQVADFRRDLIKKFGEASHVRRSTVEQEVGKEASEAMRKWLESVYRGEHGRGELVVTRTCDDMDARPQRGLVRVVPIEDPTGSRPPHYLNEAHAQLKGNSTVSRRNIYRPGDPGLDFVTFGDVDQFFLCRLFAEVDFSGTTRAEVDALYKKLRKNNWMLSEISDVFPVEYMLTVHEGEVIPFGGCSHHSGDITGKQVVLPSGRFAVISEYHGENEGLFGEHRFWGVVDDPKLKPNWSARGGCWKGPSLEAPTQEEASFLLGMEGMNLKSLTMPGAGGDEDE